MTGQPRCIAFTGRQRCPHMAAPSMGDVYVCTRHGIVTLAILTDRLLAGVAAHAGGQRLGNVGRRTDAR